MPRFEKRGNEKTASWAKKIIVEAEKVTKTKAEGVAKDKPAKDTAKEIIKAESTGSPKTKIEPVAGMKRQREGPTTVGQPAKKINPGSLAVAATSKQANVVTKRTVSNSGADAKAISSTVAASKTKGQQVQAKPSSFFSSLQSAAKRPGASKASTASVLDRDKSTTEKKTIASSANAAANKPAWSFAETMANLNKSKEPEPTAKPKPNSPPETPEERAKRLRKEERRKLRVSFKPEASLVEIRIFERQDEELADRDNNVRDVDDKGGEGRMFKQHMDTVDIEDDDDYSPEYDEVTLIDFREPSFIDFSAVEKAERERNYAPYGGGELKADSPESIIQEQHERNTLMVFYADRADIPPCPREPANPYTGEVPNAVNFGPPPPEILQRAEAVKNSLITQQSPAPMVPDVSALLKALGGAQSQQQAQPSPQQQKQDVGTSSTSALESIFAKFANPAQQAQPQQALMQASVQPQQSSVNPHVQAILATMQNQTPMQQPMQQGQQQAPPNLAALLQQLHMPAGQAPMQGFGIPNQQGTPQQHSGPFEDPERKRWREDQEANQGNYGNPGNQGGGNKKRKFVDVSDFYRARFTLALSTNTTFISEKVHTTL